MRTDTLIEQALIICNTYNKGNGCYNNSMNEVAFYATDLEWLVAFSIFELSKLDIVVFEELRRLKAVSLKHSLLLAKNNTSKHDFTILLEACPFVHSIDTTLQSFRFKRDTKSVKLDLQLLRKQLALIGLDLIAEEQDTRSGAKLTTYFYDVKTETKGE